MMGHNLYDLQSVIWEWSNRGRWGEQGM